MKTNKDLCKILKGHEGESFYNSILDENLIFTGINNDSLIFKYKTLYVYAPFKDEIKTFPSKNQRDWNEWAEEQLRNRLPKTWDEFCENSEGEYDDLGCGISMTATLDGKTCDFSITNNGTPIEVSALALLKIHQLIEAGYGGNITNEEWNSNDIDKYCINCYISDGYDFLIESYRTTFNHIAFHTKGQAEEFLSHPENVQLLKDYFMV